MNLNYDPLIKKETAGSKGINYREIVSFGLRKKPLGTYYTAVDPFLIQRIDTGWNGIHTD